MRCPEVIVGAVNDVIARAQTQGKLVGRIDKPFRYFPPAKEEDSKLNPQINFVHTSVQSTRANYFGRYVAQTVGQIPESDFEKATSKNESCVLVIGSRPYLPQIRAHLVEAGLLAEDVLVARDERKEGLVLLKMNPKSNLGWRILLGHDDPVEARVCIQKSVEEKVSLVDVISEEFKKRILAEIYQQNDEETKEEETEVKVPRILLTSYEGAKGLSAQHVILAGLHNGELPRRLANIDDIEICKFLVGLTRTRKKCTIISTKRFGMVYKNRSVFVDWINQNRIFGISVDAAYWQIST